MKYIKIFFPLMIIFLIFVVLFTYCEKKPTAPEHDNPLDTENPATAGDPFQLQAQISGGGVSLTWNVVNLSTLQGYNIYRTETENGSFAKIASVARNSTSYVDQTVENGHSYWYKVVAYDNSGKESSQTNVAEVRINTDPVIVITGGAQYTASRQVSLTILATTATQMWISNSADFSDGNWENYATSKTWLLTTGKGIKTVHLKVKYSDDTISNVSVATIEPQPMNPSIIIANDSTYTAIRAVILTLMATGENLKMKVSEDSSFAGVSWETFATTKSYTLSTNDGIKTVYARFKNDFEMETSSMSDNIILDTTPATAAFSVLPTSGITAETTFNFDATATTDNIASANEIQIRWDWENDGSYDTPLSTDKTATHQYSTGGGDKTVKLEAKDGAGNTSSTTQQIYVNTRPVASFSVTPTSGDITENFNFDASACSDYEDNTAVLQVRWDWDGDGSYDTGYSTTKTASHQYSSSGTKNVILEVKDSSGLTDTTSQQINVIPEWAEGMVYVAAGSFQMGSNSGDSDEQPVHTVYLNAFYIDKYEVTNAKYAAYLNAALAAGQIQVSSSEVTKGGYRLLYLASSYCQISYSGGTFIVDSGKDNYPVILVTWYGAKAYAEHYGKRLPTEAEWEYAARGGNQSQGYTYSGSNNVGDVAWYFGNSGSSTHTVGTKQPNELGIYDMSGNVWEWCHDWYNSGYYSSSPGSNPPGPSSGTYRVLRGGSWYNDATYCRVAYRRRLYPDLSNITFGFRVVQDSP